ncbi:hypothetical protein L7F22_066819 [Adiantum nelumboides]|nr:hypothetical protein [Adiantum nelumboides]
MVSKQKDLSASKKRNIIKSQKKTKRKREISVKQCERIGVQWQTRALQANWLNGFLGSELSSPFSELEHLPSLPEESFVDLQQEGQERDPNNLSKHVKSIFKETWENSLCKVDGFKEKGSPTLLVLCSSAARCLDFLNEHLSEIDLGSRGFEELMRARTVNEALGNIGRVLSLEQISGFCPAVSLWGAGHFCSQRGLRSLTKACKPAKLFAKHIKVEEQVKALQGHVNIAVGTPNRNAWKGQQPDTEVVILVQQLMDAVAQYALNAVILFFPAKMPLAQDVGQWVDFLLKRQAVRGVYFGVRGFYESECQESLFKLPPSTVYTAGIHGASPSSSSVRPKMGDSNGSMQTKQGKDSVKSLVNAQLVPKTDTKGSVPVSQHPHLHWQPIRIVGSLGKRCAVDPVFPIEEAVLWRPRIWEGCPLSQIVWDPREWYWPSEQRLGEAVYFFEYSAPIGRDIMRRVKKLIDIGALGLGSLEVVLMDMHEDAKGFTISTIPQIKEDLLELCRTHLHQHALNGRIKFCLY